MNRLPIYIIFAFLIAGCIIVNQNPSESYNTKTIHEQRSSEKILFSEIYYDTTGTDSDEEYIELYNPTDNDTNLTGWIIEDNANQYTISYPSTVMAHTFFTLARDGPTFQSAYGKLPDKDDLTLGLNNAGDELTLYDNNTNQIDFVAWENYVAGWDIVADTGNTIKRTDPNIDTNTSADWSSNQPQNPKTQLDTIPEFSDIIITTTGLVTIFLIIKKRRGL